MSSISDVWMPVFPEQQRPAPFFLDIDPEPLRAAAQILGKMAEEFGRRGAKVSSQPEAIGTSWTGRAATTAKEEMHGLGDHLTDFVGMIADSRAAVTRLATQYEDALEQVDRLNRQWDAAQAAYVSAASAAQRQSRERREGSPWGDADAGTDSVRFVLAASSERVREENRLQRAFEDLQAQVRNQTRACARELDARVPLQVSAARVKRYRVDGAVGVVGERPTFTDTLPMSAERDWHASAVAEAGREAAAAKRRIELVDQFHKGLSDSVTVRDGWFRTMDKRLDKDVELAHAKREQARAEYRHAYRRAQHLEVEELKQARVADNELRSTKLKVEAQKAKLGPQVLRGFQKAGPVLMVAGAGWSLYKGEPVDEVGVKLATGLAVGAVATFVTGAAVASAPVSVPLAGIVLLTAAGIGATIAVTPIVEKEVLGLWREGKKWVAEE